MIAANTAYYAIQDATTESRIVTCLIILAVIAVVFFAIRRNKK